MTKYIFIMLAILISLSSAHAIDQTTVNSLNQKGFDVIMGELTGAGSKVSMNRLAGFVLSDGILLKEQCGAIVVKNASTQDVASIVRVVFENQNIEASEFEGIIVKK